MNCDLTDSHRGYSVSVLISHHAKTCILLSVCPDLLLLLIEHLHPFPQLRLYVIRSCSTLCHFIMADTSLQQIANLHEQY